MKAKRSHWKIENQAHRIPGIAYREAEILAVLRHVALNFRKNQKTAKGDIHVKRLQAGWNNDHLLTILKT